MSTPPTISIVIPAYRAATTIGAAISGALTQSYPRVEVLCVDDGSPDETARLVEAYGAAVRLLRQANAGVSAARNAAAAVATGDFLLFCDADDVLLPGALSAAMDVWRAGPPRRIVTLNAYPLTEAGIDTRREVLQRFPVGPQAQRIEILRSNFVCGLGIIPTGVFTELGGYDQDLRVVEDWDLWLRAIFAGVEIDYVRTPQALYRRSEGTLSTNLTRMLAGEDEMIRRFAARDLNLTPDERDLLQRRLRHGSPWRLRAEGDAALEQGRGRDAARAYSLASALLPHDRRLALRARSLRAMPATARLWQRRDASRHLVPSDPDPAPEAASPGASPRP